MTTTFDVRTMALVLRQGARLDTLSRGAMLIAAGWLVASLAWSSPPGLVVVITLVASLVAGGAQSYYALRVGFDAGLFAAAADAMQADAPRATVTVDQDALPHVHACDLAGHPTHVTGVSASDDAIDALSSSPATAAAMLDNSLISLGLLPLSRAGRDWPARWAGASRLLRLQSIWLTLQLSALLITIAIALWFPFAVMFSRTMSA